MRIYNINRIPEAFKIWLNKEYPADQGFTHGNYWKYGNKITYYGAEVYKNGKFWSIPQGSEEEFLNATCTHEIMNRNYTCAACGFTGIVMDESNC